MWTTPGKRADASPCGPIRPTLAIAASAGFSLVELLVALVLLSMMFVLLVGGLQFATNIWNEREQSTAQTSQVLAVQNVLRRLLSEARPVMVQMDKTKRRQVLFIGTQNSVRFVAPMLQQLGSGGLYEIGLHLTGGKDPALEMSWRVFPSAGKEERVVLLHDIRNLQFAFFGRSRTNRTPEWHSGWQDTQNMPELVRMQIDHRWPQVVVAPVVQSMHLIVADPETGVIP